MRELAPLCAAAKLNDVATKQAGFLVACRCARLECAAALLSRLDRRRTNRWTRAEPAGLSSPTWFVARLSPAASTQTFDGSLGRNISRLDSHWLLGAEQMRAGLVA